MNNNISSFHIGIEKQVSLSEILGVFSEMFPKAKIIEDDKYVSEDSSKEYNNEIVMTVYDNQSEFNTQLVVSLYPESEAYVVEIAYTIACYLSKYFNCDTICDGSGYEDNPSGSPYWSIIWSKDKSYLADDACTDWGDGKGGPVKRVKQLKLNLLSFNECGKINKTEQLLIGDG